MKKHVQEKGNDLKLYSFILQALTRTRNKIKWNGNKKKKGTIMQAGNENLNAKHIPEIPVKLLSESQNCPEKASPLKPH